MEIYFQECRPLLAPKFLRWLNCILACWCRLRDGLVTIYPAVAGFTFGHRLYRVRGKFEE